MRKRLLDGLDVVAAFYLLFFAVVAVAGLWNGEATNSRAVIVFVFAALWGAVTLFSVERGE